MIYTARVRIITFILLSRFSYFIQNIFIYIHSNKGSHIQHNQLDTVIDAKEGQLASGHG